MTMTNRGPQQLGLVGPLTIGAVLAHKLADAIDTKADAPRPLHVIAQEIYDNWTKVYFGAVPYLRAMNTLDSMTDNYGCDGAEEIVLRFLCNAKTWKGDVARRIKAELKGMVK
jgi:hypothetical protein